MSAGLAAACALIAGAALGAGFCKADMRRMRRRVRELQAGGKTSRLVQSVTRFLFVTTQLAALGWVSVSYMIAVYSTMRLEQPFPVVELSQQAIVTILGANVLKVVENIFEHNSGPVFGRSIEAAEPPDEGAGDGRERNDL